MRLNKREAIALLHSLAAGVVPRTGLRHIAVGRAREMAAFQQDFEHIRDGGATVRFVIGRFGSGKSFLLQLARAHALQHKFIVAHADFTPDRRSQGTGGQALATYRELMRNLSTQTRPDGNALPAIIERWLSGIQADIVSNQGLEPGSTQFVEAVRSSVFTTVSNIEGLVHGFHFGTVINAYYRGYLDGNDTLKSNAIRWLRGEFTTKTETREALGVRTIIDDDTFYDYLKVIAYFAHQIGYAGLLVCFDEAVNLYKITNSVARNSSYEKILAIVNDCIQGRASYLGVIFSGTPEFLEDQRRGLFSYEALRTRLAPSRFATNELRDFSGPVFSLPPLSSTEVYTLLQKVRDVHIAYAPNSKPINDAGIDAYMNVSLQRIGATEFATPRDIVRDFVNLLNLLAQYPDKTWGELLGTLPTASKHDSQHHAIDQATAMDTSGDPLDQFTNFRVS